MSAANDIHEAGESGWHAELDIVLRPAAGRTVIAERRSQGPLRVQRPFHPEGETCHVYLLHPPGGIVGGDRLAVTVRVEAGARALLTTPGAGKFYRSGGAAARQTQHLRIEGDGCLEWLPQEAIVFDGALASTLTRIDASPEGRCIAWDVVCLGRPAAGERYESGRFVQRLEVFREGVPVLLEGVAVDGDGDVLRAFWGLGGRSVCATLIAFPCTAECLALVGEVLARADGGPPAAATLVDGVLLVRCLGDGAEAVRGVLTDCRNVLRPRLLGLGVCLPRIWNT
ncbi:MAG: urease accessory protein UreD [Gammaproteobacteria bacterium]|jgi:urease accessory protein|nr:urease accessory protein UreD [Gammaproteobacteria bacterium]